MFEDFRKQAEQSEFRDEDQDELPLELKKKKAGRILGMTPVQRFIVALMLLLMTIILGVLFLLVTGRLALPFLG